MGTNRVSFDLSKVSKMNINFELLRVSKMTNLKIYISPVTKKLETSNLDSRLTSLKGFHWLLLLAQVVVISLAHKYETNLFILCYRGATVIKFGQ